MNTLSKDLFETTPEMTPDRQQALASIKETMNEAGVVMGWLLLPPAFGWVAGHLQSLRVVGKNKVVATAFGLLMGSDPNAMAIEAALGFGLERGDDHLIITTEYGQIAWEPGVGLWRMDAHPGAFLKRRDILREWLKRSALGTLDGLLDKQKEEGLKRFAHQAAFGRWIESWALKRFPALAHDDDRKDRFEREDLHLGAALLALMGADADRYRKRHRLSRRGGSTPEQKEAAERSVHSDFLEALAGALSERASRPSQAARIADRGRPSSGPTLWAWLLKEHARTGMVPPPAEAVRQEVVGREGARTHYSRWLKSGLLHQPYKGCWSLVCGPARYREGF